MTTNELFYGTDFPIWENQPECIQAAQRLIPPVINLNKQYVPKYNISPVDNRGYQLSIEPQDFAGTCVISSNRHASLITTAAQNGFWCNPATEEMYGRVRSVERKDPTAQQNKFGVHPTVAARVMVKDGWVIRGKYATTDLRYSDPAKSLAWENTDPPSGLPKLVRNKDIYRITTLDGISRSLIAKRAVVFQVPWAWTRTDMYGRIQPVDLGGWHSQTIFGLTNNYDKNLPGIFFMIMNSFRLKIMSGADSPVCSGRGTGLYSFDTPDVLKAITSGFCSSVGPLVKV